MENIYILDNDYLGELEELFLLNGVQPFTFHGYTAISGLDRLRLKAIISNHDRYVDPDACCIALNIDGKQEILDLITIAESEEY